MTAQQLERRTFQVGGVEIRAAAKEGERRSLAGHAAVFNEPADIGGYFQERVAPGAFTASIAADDIRALWNHDPNHVLGRNTAGTLRLAEDERGLAIEIDPPDTQLGRDLMVLMERGDVSQMSFGFRTLEDHWEYGADGETEIRTLIRVQLLDVSPVTYPAYAQTDIAVRSRDEWRAAQQPPAAAAADRSTTDRLRRRIALAMRA